MQLKTLQSISGKLGHFLSQNSPTILTGLGVSGVLGCIKLTGNAKEKAMDILNRERDQREKDSIVEGYGGAIDPISKKDEFLLTWKCYIPVAITAGTTIFCIVGANTINLRRQAALAGLYSLAETALKEYQSKVVEIIGEKKELLVRDELAKDRINKNPVNDAQVIVGNDCDTLCYESLSGRYFRCDIEKIRKVQNDFNQRLLEAHYRTLNEFYAQLDLEETSMGKMVGWTSDHMLDIRFSSQLAKGNRPCLVLEYRHEPHIV